MVVFGAHSVVVVVVVVVSVVVDVVAVVVAAVVFDSGTTELVCLFSRMFKLSG